MRPIFLLVVLLATPSWAAEFAVVQCVLPTVDGNTVDCTSSGFGTPKGALIFGSYGTANGTAVAPAGFSIGGYDGTRQMALSWADRDAQATSDSGWVRDTNSAYLTLLESSQAQDSDCTAAWITDGLRLTCADAPPSAYRVNVLLIGGAGVSSVTVGSATGNATQNSTTAVTAPGYQPDVVIAWAHTGSTSTSGGNMYPSVGFATNNGSIVQRAMAFGSSNAQANMNVASILSTNRLVSNGVNGATLATLELTSFDANGFTVTTRDNATGPVFIYMTIKLNGLNATVLTSAAPTATGNQSVTGVGFTPQVGVMLQGEFAAVDTLYGSDNGEVFGVSAFTSSASGTAGFYTEDGDATSLTESITDTKVCRTRKNSADYATCTLVSLDSNGATFNYTATNGTARQRAILFVEAAAAAASVRRTISPMVFE